MRKIDFIHHCGPTRSCFWCRRSGPEWVTVQYKDDDLPHVQKQFNRDHLFPISQGGCSHSVNIATSCVDCNVRKADEVGGEWTLPSRVILHVISCDTIAKRRQKRGLTVPVEDLFRPCSPEWSWD